MKTLVQRIVDQSSAVAAGLGVVLSPFPFADEALLLPLLGTMTVRIGRVHGLHWKAIPWKAVGKTAAGGLAARATFTLGVTYIPVVAAVANAATAATLAGAFGAYADRACSDPAQAHLETLEELKVDVRDLAARWRRLCNLGGSETTKPGGRSMEKQSPGVANGGPRPNALNEVIEEVRTDIEHALRTRHPGHGRVLFAVEDKTKSAGAKVWEHLKTRPYAGIAAASALGFVVASASGVGELAAAVLCGYAAYEVLRRGRSVGQAVEDVVMSGKMV